jgi:adenylate cyclase
VEFSDQGATDYLARITPFGDDGIIDGRTGIVCSWTSDRPGGFDDIEVAILDRLQPRLALTVKTVLGLEITRNIVDAYIGPKTGRRILRGEIRRGASETIHAVIFYADLRGFTALVDRVARDELVPMLDEYLECIVQPVVDHGGEVLKFMGDGLLATFDLDTNGGESICSVALEAAVGALRLTQELNSIRAAAGKPTTYLDVALHLGDVLYGNVGGRERLDFTVIGPAVNEASRIEGLCDQLGRRLLISDSFASAATQCTSRLVSVGKFRLRGVEREQEVFSLDIPEAMA